MSDLSALNGSVDARPVCIVTSARAETCGSDEGARVGKLKGAVGLAEERQRCGEMTPSSLCHHLLLVAAANDVVEK